jgi:hypothetical protein
MEGWEMGDNYFARYDFLLDLRSMSLHNSSVLRRHQRMMRAGTETGSLINHLYSRAIQPAPEVGMGATILCWTDRHPGTIIKVTPTQVHVQEDHAVRLDKNGLSECQKYAYSINPEGRVHVFRKTKKGYRNTAGNGLTVGGRDKYYDYSF